MANKQLNEEIEEMAEKMAKSASDKETLFETIRSLGPEVLKKAMATLSPKQKEVLKSALEEMAKAANEPKDSEDAKALTPEKTTTDAKQMKTESLSGSDDEDEKLVKEKNSKIDNQGDHNVEGLESPVIKSQQGEGSKGGKVIGHTRSGKPIYEGKSHAQHKRDRESTPINEKVPGAKNDKDHEHYNLKDHIDAYAFHRVAKRNLENHGLGHSKEADKHDRSLSYHDEKIGHLTNGHQFTDEHKKMGREAQEHYERTLNPNPAKKPRDSIVNGVTARGEPIHAKETTKKSMNCDALCEPLKKEQGVPEGVDPEKWERGVKEVKKDPKVDNPYAVVNAAMTKGEGTEMDQETKQGESMDPKKHEEIEQKEDAAIDQLKEAQDEEKAEKEKKMQKSLKKIVKLAKALRLSKDQVKERIVKANGNLKLVKAEMQAEKLKEEAQSKFKGQDESEVTSPKPETGGDEDLKHDAPKNADEALAALDKIQKSVKWSTRTSISAGTLGRNTHWDVDAYIEKSEADRQEIIKKGGYLNETEVKEELKKSEGGKADINDLIAKGYDFSQDQIEQIQGVHNVKPDQGALRKSYYDQEIARSMGMSKEEYEKIFGSNE